MKTINEFLPLADILVKELSEQINMGNFGLKEAEEKIVEFINKIGHLLLEDVVEAIKEPVLENHIILDGKNAFYKDMQNLRFRNRFGQEIIRSRRAYSVEGQSKGYYPLDEKFGMDKCWKYSPLMTYLQSLFGGCEPYSPASKKLSKALGFNISSTAIQNNTELTGFRLEHHPFKVIPEKKQNEECDVMVVEIDGTMSPQIMQKEGITGRKSLKLPTEYKECNIIAIEKYNNDKKIDEWTGARYGPRKIFDNYVHQSGLRMGQLKAKEIVFIADGAKHNWEIQLDNFPDSTCILDFYHATEHLSDFCELFKDKKIGRKQYDTWYEMLYEGEILQVLSEMKKSLEEKISNNDEALKHYNYFENNKSRMQYDLYREKGFPIGSGLVEGKCKLVVGKRFKGNGMRWKKADNEAVLKVRLAVLNNTLDQDFKPDPRIWKKAS